MLMIQSLAFRRAIICEVYYCTVQYCTVQLSTERDHSCRLQQLLQLQTNRTQTNILGLRVFTVVFHCFSSVFPLLHLSSCRDIAFQKNENDVIPE